MNKRYKKIFLVLLFVFGFSNLFAENTDIKLQVVPSIFRAEIRPGENINFTITLKNVGNREIKVSGNVYSIQMEEDGSPLMVDEPYLSHSCQSWIHYNPKSLFIKPKEKRDVAVSIQSSNNASGGNYGVILFELTDKEEAKKPGLSLALRTGTTIMLTVRNSTKLDAKLESFSASNMDNKTVFEVNFRNDSNVHVKPNGSIIIYNNDKKIIDRVNIGENNFVLPCSNRLFKFVWDNKKRTVKQYVSLLTAECKIYVKGLNKIFNQKVEFVRFN